MSFSSPATVVLGGVVFKRNNEPVEITAETLCYYIKAAVPGVRALVLMSCYTDAHSAKIQEATPILITIDGPASDAAVVVFLNVFYERLYSGDSFERAMHDATNRVSM